MSIFLKAAAGVLVTAVLCMTLSKQAKDISLLLAMAVCSMVILAAVAYLEPVINFFSQLQSVGNLDTDMLRILLKAVGIGFLAEIVGLICADAGNAAVGKALKLLASVVILWISMPLFSSLIELVEDILVIL